MPASDRFENRRRPVSPLPWLILALDLLLAGAYVFLALSNGRSHFAWDSLAFAAFPLTAALVIQRQPRNLAGWGMAVMGYLFLLSNAASEYAYYAYVTRPGALPFADLIAWISYWCWTFGDPLAVVAILLFPNGRPPSPRWWIVIAFALLGNLPLVGYIMYLSWPVRGLKLVSQSIIDAMGPVAAHPLLQLLIIWNIFYMACLVLAVTGMAVRLARSQGIERLQLKWIFFALVLVPIGVGANLFVFPTRNPFSDSILMVLNLLSVISFPIAMAFAVTRHRLYEIDVIIRRTLLYSTLTVTLALFYFGSVFLLQTLLTKIGGSQSPVSVVLSTLLIAALFSPLRARFQKVIDRRFYRRAYNSEQILARFTDRLRTEVGLEAINAHLLDLVDESLQPAFSSLWLVDGRKAFTVDRTET